LVIIYLCHEQSTVFDSNEISCWFFCFGRVCWTKTKLFVKKWL